MEDIQRLKLQFITAMARREVFKQQLSTPVHPRPIKVEKKSQST